MPRLFWGAHSGMAWAFEVIKSPAGHPFRPGLGGKVGGHRRVEPAPQAPARAQEHRPGRSRPPSPRECRHQRRGHDATGSCPSAGSHCRTHGVLRRRGPIAAPDGTRLPVTHEVRRNSSIPRRERAHGQAAAEIWVDARGFFPSGHRRDSGSAGLPDSRRRPPGDIGQMDHWSTRAFGCGMSAFGRRSCRRLAQRHRSALHGADDRDMRAAAAQIAGKLPADGRLIGVGIALQQGTAIITMPLRQ